MESRIIVVGGREGGKCMLMKQLLAERNHEPDIDVWCDELVENPFLVYARKNQSGMPSRLLMRLMSVISKPLES